MTLSAAEFTTAIREAFAFLGDAGYSVRTDATSGRGQDLNVRFANGTTFVDVHLEAVDYQILVRLGPMVDGDTALGFDLGFILLLRGIPAPAPRGSLSGARGVRRELDEFAQALQIGAGDLLAGDFSILPLVRAVIEERRKFALNLAVKRGHLGTSEAR